MDAPFQAEAKLSPDNFCSVVELSRQYDSSILQFFEWRLACKNYCDVISQRLALVTSLTFSKQVTMQHLNKTMWIPSITECDRLRDHTTVRSVRATSIYDAFGDARKPNVCMSFVSIIDRIPTGQGKLEKWGKLRERSGENIFWKSQGKWKIGATRCQIFRLKCIKFDFRWGSAPDPAGGAYSTPQGPLAALSILPEMTCFIVIINTGI